jgi:hypothetical protein
MSTMSRQRRMTINASGVHNSQKIRDAWRQGSHLRTPFHKIRLNIKNSIRFLTRGIQERESSRIPSQRSLCPSQIPRCDGAQPPRKGIISNTILDASLCLHGNHEHRVHLDQKRKYRPHITPSPTELGLSAERGGARRGSARNLLALKDRWAGATQLRGGGASASDQRVKQGNLRSGDG